MNSKLTLKDVITLVMFVGALVAAASSFGASMNRMDAMQRRQYRDAQVRSAMVWALIELCNKNGIKTDRLERAMQEAERQ